MVSQAERLSPLIEIYYDFDGKGELYTKWILMRSSTAVLWDITYLKEVVKRVLSVAAAVVCRRRVVARVASPSYRPPPPRRPAPLRLRQSIRLYNITRARDALVSTSR